MKENYKKFWVGNYSMGTAGLFEEKLQEKEYLSYKNDSSYELEEIGEDEYVQDRGYMYGNIFHVFRK